MNITFVLGAGASMDITVKHSERRLYPSGKELIDKIVNDKTFKDFDYHWNGPPEEKYRLLNGYNEDQRKILKEIKPLGELEAFEKFVQTLKHSKKRSLDFIIHQYPEFSEFGKYFTHKILSDIEVKFLLYLNSGKIEYPWLDYLMEKDILSPANIYNHKISFITFNYDHTLAQYIGFHYPYTYHKDLSGEDYFELLRRIEIVHIHGSLRNSEQINRTLLTQWPVSPEYHQNNRSNIRTIHEAKSTEQFNRSQEIIAKSNRVFILGFGFNKENTDQLFHCPFPINETFATAVGMSQNEIEEAIYLSKNQLTHKRLNDEIFEAHTFEDYIYPCSITELFRENRPVFKPYELY